MTASVDSMDTLFRADVAARILGCASLSEFVQQAVRKAADEVLAETDRTGWDKTPWKAKPHWLGNAEQARREAPPKP